MDAAPTFTWDPLSIAAMLAIGAVAGFMNVTAGGGSLLTVPLMVVFGLPSPVANGTNRLALIVQNVIAVRTFRRGGVRGLRRVGPLIALAVPGALLGAWAGVVISDELFRRVLGILMIAVTAVIFLRPPSHRSLGDEPSPYRAATLASFAALGFYAGFVQAGIGFFITLALAGLERFPLVRAHAFKVSIVLCLQAVALPVFALGGKVAWGPGLLLAIGLSAGGFAGAHTALRSGERFLKLLLAACALALAVRMLVG
jgi:hypothetical protein